MGLVIVEVSGGVADISHIDEQTKVVHIDWDNLVADRQYAIDMLERIDWRSLPPRHTQRIKGMIAEIWNDLDEESFEDGELLPRERLYTKEELANLPTISDAP